MSTEGVIAGSVVGVVVGVVAAHVAMKVEREVLAAKHTAELEGAQRDGHAQGWIDASRNANNIRNRFAEMFGDPDEESGTTTKARKR